MNTWKRGKGRIYSYNSLIPIKQERAKFYNQKNKEKKKKERKGQII